MRYSHPLRLYKKRWHIAFTFLIIILPFLFIIIFSRLSGVEMTQVFTDLGASFMRIATAYIISVILAVLGALILGQGKLGNFLLPFFDVLQSFPSFALLPIFTIWFGVGNATAIFFLVVTMVWPILFSMLSVLHMARQDLREAAYVFGARGVKKIFYFMLPVAFPGLIVGSIVGLGEGWEAIVGAEIIGITPGIGGFLNAASEAGNIKILSFGIAALLLFLFSVNKLVWLPLLRRSHDYSHE